jgi:hypothetical protein
MYLRDTVVHLWHYESRSHGVHRCGPHRSGSELLRLDALQGSVRLPTAIIQHRHGTHGEKVAVELDCGDALAGVVVGLIRAGNCVDDQMDDLPAASLNQVRTQACSNDHKES